MSDPVKRNLCFLQLLGKTNSKLQRKALLDTITRDQLKAIIEITYNVIELSVPVPKSERKKLVKNIGILKEIGNKSSTQKKVLVLVKQNPTLIVLLVKTVLPTLESLF